MYLGEEPRRDPSDIQVDKKKKKGRKELSPRTEVALFCVLVIKEETATVVTSHIMQIDLKAIFSGSRRGRGKGLLREINHK